MTPEEYISLADRTNSHKFCPPSHDNDQQLLHAAIGLSTESGELLDSVKKCLFYGKPLDEVNYKEELGDILWYVACACKAMNWSMEDIMQMNINKLTKRYPEKFTVEAAYQRDLKAERELLEKEFADKGMYIPCKKCGYQNNTHSPHCPIGGDLANREIHD